MSATTFVGGPATTATWVADHTRWLLVGLHVPFGVAGPLFVITRLSLTLPTDVAIALAGATLFGLQLRHSVAFSRGERPAGWPLTFAAVVAVTYGAMVVGGWDWAAMQWFPLASALMLVRGRAGVALALALVTGSMVANGRAVLDAGYGLVPLAADTAYWLVVLGMGTAALVGSARLAQVVDELRAARQEVVELAVGRERLRVSRDLHDLLGQSLSAVSLKGDLALRLLATDGEAARAEIEGLTDVARGALRDVRAVARDEHAVSLRAEVDAAAALLGAAGVEVRTDLAVGHLPAGVEQVLAWAVREGATNALRHADATTWDVTATVVPGTAVTLEMVNDGTHGPARPHGGLDGLADRARELAGTVAAGPEPGGRFRLAVTVPTRPASPVPAGTTDREHA